VVPFKPLTLRAELHAAKGPATPPDNEDLETVPDEESLEMSKMSTAISSSSLCSPVEMGKTATSSSLCSPEKTRETLRGSLSPSDRPLYDAPAAMPLRPRSPITHASGSLSAETESLTPRTLGGATSAGSPAPDTHEHSNAAIVTEAFTDYVTAMGSGGMGEWTSKWLTHDAVVYPTNRHLLPEGYTVGRQAFCAFYNKALTEVMRSENDTLGFRILSVEGTDQGGRVVAAVTHSCGGAVRMSPPDASVLRCFDFILRDGVIAMMTSGPWQGASPVRSDLRPCNHNSWEEVPYPEEGLCMLRCRECYSEWVLKRETVTAARCPAFDYAHSCGDPHCSRLHITTPSYTCAPSY